MAVFLVRQPRSVFVHIPKTGGGSIRHGFFEGNVDGPKQGFIPEQWQSLFKFAFVRNPYDRTVSAWKMFSGGMKQSVWQQPDDEHGISLTRFLEIATDESIPFDGNRETTAEKIRHHAIPQTHPFNCLSQVDFVGRFETFQESFATICRRLEIQSNNLPHWNQTDRKPDYLKYFEPETLKIVEQFYSDDFKTLGYALISEAPLQQSEGDGKCD